MKWSEFRFRQSDRYRDMSHSNGGCILLLIEEAGLRLLECKLFLQNAGLYCLDRVKVKNDWNEWVNRMNRQTDECVSLHHQSGSRCQLIEALGRYFSEQGMNFLWSGNPEEEAMKTPPVMSNATQDSKTVQCNATEGNAKQDKTRQCNGRQGKATQHKARQHKIRQEKTKQGNGRQRKAMQHKRRQDKATQCNATQCNATQDNATQRKETHTYTVLVKHNKHRFTILSCALVRSCRTCSVMLSAKETLSVCLSSLDDEKKKQNNLQ